MNVAKIISVIIAVGAAIFFLYGYLQSDTITNYPPKNTTIVAFGDSLVEGQGATEGNDFVSVLGRSLNRDIINLGVRGDTTKDGIARMGEVIEHDPGIVILLLGGNDFLRKVPRGETEKNLKMLIEAFQSNGAVVILLGVRGSLMGDSTDVLYAGLSEEYGTLYVEDVLEGIFLKPGRMSDGVHPNNVGYAIIADRVQSAFREYDLLIDGS